MEVEEEDPVVSRMRLGFVREMLSNNEHIEAECLRVTALAWTRDAVLNMDNHELIALSDEWIKTSVAPNYLDALKRLHENASVTFLAKLSPSDEIHACLLVVDERCLENADTTLLKDRFYAQCLLLERADYRLLKPVHSSKLAVFINDVVVKAYNNWEGKNYKVYAVAFKMGHSDPMCKRF